MSKFTKIKFILLWLFIIFDVVFYTQISYEYRSKQSIILRMLPGSGYVYFIKEKLSESK